MSGCIVFVGVYLMCSGVGPGFFLLGFSFLCVLCCAVVSIVFFFVFSTLICFFFFFA